jgi:hypothetical protein
MSNESDIEGSEASVASVASSMSKTQHNKKKKNWVFTMYGICEDESDKLEELVTSGFAKTIFFGHEICPKTNRPHIQGYLVCANANSLTNVVSKLNKPFAPNKPNPHVEPARGTAVENYTYSIKERLVNPDAKHRHYGAPVIEPGRKHDDDKYQTYTNLIEEGKITLAQIAEEDLGHFTKHHERYEFQIGLIAQKSIKPPTFVAWFSGDSGTGKSYTAERIAETLGYEIYSAGFENNFFNTYHQEEASIWNDYRPMGMAFGTLLRITDRKGSIINVKGAKTFFNPRIQIFTSPYGIEITQTKDMLQGTEGVERFIQFKRRVGFTAHFASSDRDSIPSLDKVEANSLNVTERFLGVYKQHLIDAGFAEYANNHKVLNTVTPILFKRLIPINPTTEIAMTYGE